MVKVAKEKRFLDKLQYGSHLCLFYESKQDLIDALIPFFKEGLENNELCLWIIPGFIDPEEAEQVLRESIAGFDERLREGQLEILNYDQWYVEDGDIDLKRILDKFSDKLDQALNAGYNGLRLSGDTTWLKEKDWKNFIEYEREIHESINLQKIVALCTYPLNKCGANEIIDVIENHHFVTLVEEGDWRIVEKDEYRRKGAFELLKESQDYFYSLCEDAPLPYQSLDGEGYILYVNRAWLDQLGYGREEVVGKWFGDFLDPNSLDYFKRNFILFKQKGEIKEVECEVIKKDGSSITCLFNGSLSYDSQGEVSQTHCIFKDVTKSKEAEKAVRESEQSYRSLAEHLQGIVYRVYMQENNRMEFFNDMVKEVTGYREEELKAGEICSIDPLIIPEDREKVINTVNSTIKHNKPFEVDYRIRHKNGEIKYLIERGKPIYYEGTPLYIEGVIFDVTEHKESEKELARQYSVLEGINMVLEKALSCKTDEEVARMFLNTAEQLTDSKFGFVCEINQNGRYDTIAISDPRWEACRMPDAITKLNDVEIRGIRGKVNREAKSIIFNQPTSDSDWVEPPEGHPSITSFLGVPLKSDGDFVGLIGLGNKESGYTFEDKQTIETLSMAFMEALNRKRIEMDLKENEAELSAIIEASPFVMMIVDSERRVCRINNSGAEFAGRSPEELFGLRGGEALRCVYSLDDPQGCGFGPICQNCTIHQTVLDTIEKERPHHGVEAEMTFFSQQGREDRTLLVYTTPLILLGERRVLVVLQDITKLKEFEKELFESYSQFKDLANLILVAVFETDLNGRVTFFNVKALELTGYTWEDLHSGIYFHHLFVDEDMDRVERVKTDILKGEQLGPRQYTIKRKDGTTLSVEINSVPVISEEEVKGLRGTAEDITQRKQEEGALKRKLMKFKLDNGKVYLAKEQFPVLAREALDDLRRIGYKGLIISRQPVEELNIALDDDIKYLWLSEAGDNHSISPELSSIEKRIKEVSNRNVIFLDSLDYLVFKNGVKNTLKLVQRLRELAYLKQLIVILSIDPHTLSEHDFSLLDKELSEIELMYPDVPQTASSILNFVYKQNSAGIKPSYTEISQKLNITRQSVGKWVRYLASKGYIREEAHGRSKLAEITDKGRHFFETTK